MEADEDGSLLELLSCDAIGPSTTLAFFGSSDLVGLSPCAMKVAEMCSSVDGGE